MQALRPYQEQFQEYLQQHPFRKAPEALYEPVDYIMQLGGKRLRPAGLLAACHLFSDDLTQALPAAMCVEVFHNFSLVHDDIMDAAPLRRGQPTVHHKWNLNTGILSGDVMLIEAYRYLQQTGDDRLLPTLLSVFNQTAMEVCEGQQYDIDFETREDVTIPEYLKMIELKTAVLFGAALKMGAIIGGATPADADRLYDFGRFVGVAFQLQDDLLDTFGDPEKVGKKVGGDIAQNKKTFLMLKAFELAEGEDAQTLTQAMRAGAETEDQKIRAVTALFKKLGVEKAAEEEKMRFKQLGLDALAQVQAPAERKAVFEQLAEFLLAREL